MPDAIVAGVLFHPFMQVVPTLNIYFCSHNILYVILGLITSVWYSGYHKVCGLYNQVARFTPGVNAGILSLLEDSSTQPLLRRARSNSYAYPAAG